jgi:uncharacterized protein (DUF4415 family)
MKKEYDFSKAKRGAVIPESGKTRVTMYLDNDVLEAFRDRADRSGKGYQTLINEVLREHLGTETLNARTLRKIIREEINRAGA